MSQEEQEASAFATIMAAVEAVEADPERRLSRQVEETIGEAVAAVRTSGQTATVTIKLRIKRGAENRVEVSPSVDSKRPKPSVPAITLFSGPGGRLSRAPAQTSLDLASAGTTRRKDN